MEKRNCSIVWRLRSRRRRWRLAQLPDLRRRAKRREKLAFPSIASFRLVYDLASSSSSKCSRRAEAAAAAGGNLSASVAAEGEAKRRRRSRNEWPKEKRLRASAWRAKQSGRQFGRPTDWLANLAHFRQFRCSPSGPLLASPRPAGKFARSPDAAIKQTNNCRRELPLCSAARPSKFGASSSSLAFIGRLFASSTAGSRDEASERTEMEPLLGSRERTTIETARCAAARSDRRADRRAAGRGGEKDARSARQRAAN